MTGYNDIDSSISKFAGNYNFNYDIVSQDQVEKGVLIFERKDKSGYIFKNQNGTWSVSIC